MMSEKPNSLDLEAIKARVEAATPGPWKVNKRGHIGGGEFGTDPIVISAGGIEPFFELGKDGPDNSSFIAHSRTDIPALCDEIVRLRANQLPAGMELAPVGTRRVLSILLNHLPGGIITHDMSQCELCGKAVSSGFYKSGCAKCARTIAKDILSRYPQPESEAQS